MIWKEVEKKYGKEMADKMSKSLFLTGITISINKDGETNIPETDIIRAYKDVTGKKIHPLDWD